MRGGGRQGGGAWGTCCRVRPGCGVGPGGGGREGRGRGGWWGRRGRVERGAGGGVGGGECGGEGGAGGVLQGPLRAVGAAAGSGARSGSADSSCSVTSTAASGRPETWRRSTPVTGRPARSAPHQPQQPGSWTSSQSGRATCASVVPSCPSCPPGLRPVFFRNDRGDGLPSPSPEGGREGVARRLPQPRLKPSDPLAGLRQLLPRVLQSTQRIRQLQAQPCHQRGQDLRRRRSRVSGHTRTLRAARADHPHFRHTSTTSTAHYSTKASYINLTSYESTRPPE